MSILRNFTVVFNIVKVTRLHIMTNRMEYGCCRFTQGKNVACKNGRGGRMSLIQFGITHFVQLLHIAVTYNL